MDSEQQEVPHAQSRTLSQGTGRQLPRVLLAGQSGSAADRRSDGGRSHHSRALGTRLLLGYQSLSHSGQSGSLYRTGLRVGTGGGGDSVNLMQADFGVLQRLLNDDVNALHVTARRNFGHNAAIRRMFLMLRPYAVRQNSASSACFAAHNSSGRIVTARFYAKY